jgi:hypothetical protein
MSKCDEYAPVVNKIAQAAIAGLLILMMAACNVGPNYKRPGTTTRLVPLSSHIATRELEVNVPLREQPMRNQSS